MPIAKEDQKKTTFVCEFGSFAYRVMPFGLKNAPAVFSKIVVKTFQEYIYKTMAVYFDDWTIYSTLKDTGSSLSETMPKHVRSWHMKQYPYFQKYLKIPPKIVFFNLLPICLPDFKKTPIFTIYCMYPFFHLHFLCIFIFLPSILTWYPTYILQCTLLLSMYIVDAHYFTHNDQHHRDHIHFLI